nr:sulfatase-like hydrolase/transferase [Clostridium bornimense]
MIIIISDALRYKEINDIRRFDNKYEYLHKISNESLFYTKAIANSTYTKAALYSMLAGKLINYDEKYMNDNYVLSYKESELISSALDNGYYIVNESMTRLVPDNINIKNLRVETECFESCTVQLWRMLTYLCNMDSKVMYIFHFNETHTPYMCGYYEKAKVMNVIQNEIYKEKIDMREQYMETIKYIDTQLGYYMNMLSDSIYTILTSDHGQCIGEYSAYTHTFTWYDEVLHTPLIINGKDLNKEVIEDLFDKKDFGKLISSIIDKSYIEKRSRLKSEYVKSERDAIHSLFYLNDRKFIEALGSKFIKGYTVITTMDKKYVRYDDGVEELYDLDNENKNIIDVIGNCDEFRNKI